MDAVKKDVEALVQKELEAANKKFPPFHSAHEGYGVFLEELKELKDEISDIKSYKKLIKEAIHKNNNEMLLKYVEIMGNRAALAAVEAIQVAAMCEKFKISAEAKFCGKTPMLVEIKSGDIGAFALCPNCEINLYHFAEITVRSNNIKFCPHCGQMLMWGKENA